MNQIEKFARILDLSAGTFRLFLARCNSLRWRSRAIEELKSACSLALEELEIDPEETQLYDRIVAKVGEQPPEGLIVVGLERNLHLDRLFDRANQERDKYIKNLPFPLVIWTSDRIFVRLLREASDFQSIAETVELTIPAEFWADFIANTATQRLNIILQQGATRFLPPLPSERNLAFTDELQAAAGELSYPTPQIKAYLAFLQARSRGYETEARIAYEESLQQWPQDGDSSHLAIVRYCLGDWWRGQTRLHRHEAATAWKEARQQFEECLALLRQTERSELVARFINALGDALLATEKWWELEPLAREAMELHQIYPHPLRRSRACGFLAEVALASENWSLAERLAREALDILETVVPERQESLNIKYVGAFNRLALARSQRRQRKNKQSVETLKKALDEIKPEYELDLYLEILRELQDRYWQQKNYVQAYHCKRQWQDLETQFGLQAFLGARRIKPQKIERIPERSEEGNSEEIPLEIVALEIRVSGRMADVDNLVERVGRNDCKVTVLYGSSGVGKSSLIRGGLLPRLWQQRSGVESERVLPINVRSYQNWERILAEKLHWSLAQCDRDIDVSNSKLGILEVLQRCIEWNMRPVLLFDQFEEFFLVYPDRPERNEFFEFLGQCLQLLPLKVIFSLRVEYVYRLLGRPGFGCIDDEILSKKVRYYLDYFSLQQAHDVVRDLSDRAQLIWEDGLIDTFITDLSRGYPVVRPIELQIVGAQMQQEGIQTIAEYKQVGGRDVLVQHYFTEVIQDCGKQNEQLAGLALFHLTNEKRQRPLKTQADLIKDLVLVSKADTSRFEEVLEILVMSGLVIEVKDESTYYQLVHDYLVKPIRYWYDRGLRAKIEQLERDRQEAIQQAIQQEREDIRAKENIRRKKEYMKQDTLQMQIQMLQMQQTSQQALILVLIGTVIIMSVTLGTHEQIAQEEIEYLREQLQGRSVCDQWVPPDYCFRYIWD